MINKFKLSPKYLRHDDYIRVIIHLILQRGDVNVFYDHPIYLEHIYANTGNSRRYHNPVNSSGNRY